MSINNQTKLKKILCPKNIAIIMIIILVLTHIPVLYLTTVNHSTGDDLSYGEYVHAYVCGRGGFSSIFEALGKTIKQFYIGWQGTWFSIFLFALQPGVFSEKLYVLVAPVSLLLWFGSTYYLLGYLLKHRLGYDKWSCIAAITFFLLLSVEYIPSTKSSIFWYNGVAHYMIPFSMAQIAITWMLKWIYSPNSETEENKNIISPGKRKTNRQWRYFSGVCIFMTLLGGSSYQCALFVLIACVYIIINGVLYGRHFYSDKSRRRTCLLLIPLILEITGLFISALAPGNKVRGGDDFGFSASKAFSTIILSFNKEIKDFIKYIIENPILSVGIILFIALIVWLRLIVIDDASSERKNDMIGVRGLRSFISIILLWCLSSAIEAPEIYAGVEVSGGVYNIVYQTILISILGTILILVESMRLKYLNSNNRVDHSDITGETKTQERKNMACFTIFIFALGICLIVGYFNKGHLKDSLTYISYDYIRSGQASDYKEQMLLQDKILTSGEKKVIIPEVNYIQGPLMHMPVINDPSSFTNITTKEYYDLDSIEVVNKDVWATMND